MILNVLKEMGFNYVLDENLIIVKDVKERLVELTKKLDEMDYVNDTYAASTCFGLNAATRETVKEILITNFESDNGYMMIAF